MRDTVVGLDLAGSESRPTGFCVLQGLNVKTDVLFTDREIFRRISTHSPRVVAVDAPLGLPKGRHCLKEHCRGRNHFRSCDLILRRMGIRFFPITLGPMRMLTLRGIRMKRMLSRRGLEVLETYPGASQDILGIPRKQKGVEALRDGLIAQGLSGQIETKSMTADELDAITCAYTGKLYLDGMASAIGDPEEVLMILPKRRGKV